MILNPENYCILCRHKLLGQTTKLQLSILSPKNLENISSFEGWGLTLVAYKKMYYSSLNMRGITDNKKFWKTIKPLFPYKAKSAVTITLKENKKVVENQNEVANIFNNYFSKVLYSHFKFQNPITSIHSPRECLVQNEIQKTP